MSLVVYSLKICETIICSCLENCIEFKNVEFTYPGAEKPTLKNFNFKLNKGQTVAVVGENGAGKSTFTKLLLRFYDVTGGEILVDGVNIKEVSQKSLRDIIGFVPQKGVLFSGTIESNIKYGINEELLIKFDSGNAKKINYILKAAKFIKKTILLMKDILYGCQDIHFNMLDRTHHKQYFLAIGKLHMEYASAHERHYSLYFSCIEKLVYIEKTLTSKLKAPLYQLCNKNKSKIKLKKTNVFRSHKDYKNIYEIAKLFETNLESKNDNNIELDIKNEQYSNFVNLLLIFAIGHFNFKFKENEKFDFFNLDNDCSYNNWNLNIKNISENNIYGIKLTFNKDKQYSICIIYNNVSDVSDNDIQVFKEKNKANEYLFTSYEKYGKKDILYLSIYDVDSFRRLQQLLLKGMVYSDTTHDICPFCGSKLVDKEGIYECNICRGQIYEKTCPKTNNKYYVTTIKKYTSYANTNTNQKEKRKFLHDRYSDARLHFRNITPLSIDGTLLCSECGLKHN